MRLRTIVLAVVLVVVHATIVYEIARWSSGEGGGAAAGGGAAEPAATDRFPDARDTPPPGWKGPVFRLSQDYPAAMPDAGDEPWLQFDFRTQTVQYLNAVLGYALEGNVDVDFQGQDNAVRMWYHAPWLHADQATGREFIHGMTRERFSPPRDLAPTQTRTVQNWAVGMYNARGGFVLGQVWKNHDDPDPRQAQFPEGTVAFKLLFTAATVAQVPYLKNSLEWEADINRSHGTGHRPKLRLLQIDVAVRDSRADSTTGWVFGTFIYDGDAPGQTVWERMVPVGGMWGNDPDKLDDDGPLEETFINPDARVPHLGYKGRLNGPIDNRISSCLSCHSTAEIPTDLSERPTREIPHVDDPDDVARYFRNIAAEQPFTSGRLAVDYSLQLQSGIAQWAQATEGGHTLAPQLLSARRPLSATDTVRFTPARR
jgi:hypothetical protein